MRNVMIALVGLSLMATPLAAKPPLRDVAAVDDALLDLGVADRIRRQCPTISARMVTAYSFLRRIQRTAKKLGYSDAEIDAYIESDSEKARMKARGRAFFRAKGVDTSDPQSYCALGLQEIQKASRIGSLLRAK